MLCCARKILIQKGIYRLLLQTVDWLFLPIFFYFRNISRCKISILPYSLVRYGNPEKSVLLKAIKAQKFKVCIVSVISLQCTPFENRLQINVNSKTGKYQKMIEFGVFIYSTDNRSTNMLRDCDKWGQLLLQCFMHSFSYCRWWYVMSLTASEIRILVHQMLLWIWSNLPSDVSFYLVHLRSTNL